MMKSVNQLASEEFALLTPFTVKESARGRVCCAVTNVIKLQLLSHVQVVFSLIVVVCLGTAAYAQDPDGHSPNRGFLPTGSYVLSDIESISLSGGNMTYSIPLAALPPSRGGKLKPAVNLLYNSKIYETRVTIANGTFSYVQTDLVRAGWGGWHYGVGFSLDVVDRSTNYLNGAPEPQNTYKWKAAIVFPDGSKHTIRPYGWAPSPGEDYYSVNPGQAGAQEYYSTDSLYFRVHITSHPGAPYPYDFTIYLADGTVVDYNTGVQTVTDSNGNSVTVQSIHLQNGNPATQVTDQLGRQITIETPLSQPDYIRVNGYNAQQLVTTINWGTTHPQGKRYLWREADVEVWQNLPTQFPVVTGITLPNTLAYHFAYNSEIFDPAFPSKSVGWGELYRTTLPTGAVAQYSYAMDYQHDEASNVTPIDVLRDYPTQKQLSYTDSYDGINTSRTDPWTYGITFGQNTSPLSASVVGPDGGGMSEIFYDQTAGPDFEGISYKTTHADGSSVERIWQLNKPYNSNGSQLNLYVKTEFASIVNAAGTPVKTAIKDFTYDKNGNVTQTAEYDWVSYGDVPRDSNNRPTGIPGTAQVKRVAVNTFYNATPTATDSTTYSANIYSQTTAPNLRRALESGEVRSGFADTTALSRAEMVYDNPSTTGNVTQKKHWDSTKGPLSRDLTPSNWIRAQHSYDSYGNRTLTTDPRGNQSQLTYGSINGFSGLYPTLVVAPYTSPVARTTTYAYDFSTGAIKTVTDIDNSVTTQMTYDIFARPTLIQEAYGTNIERDTATVYSDIDRRVIVRADLSSTGDAKLVSIQHHDQLGRIRLSRQLEDAADDPNGTDETKGIKVQTRHVFSQPNSYQLASNPYRGSTSGAASSESTMGWTRSKTNQMGRVIEVQSFGGTSLPGPWGTSTTTTGAISTFYDSNTTTVTDQAGRQRRSLVDGLGRLSQVVEDPSGSNYLTSYAYDTLDDLTSVTQTQQTPSVTQIRRFAYDSLKRLIFAANPEQTTSSSLLYNAQQWAVKYEYDDNSNLLKKTDSRANQSSQLLRVEYTYDELNRVKTRTYFNDPQNTPAVTYTYDGSGINFSKGRLTRVSNSISTTDYLEFDALGRIKQSRQTTTDGAAQGYTTTYSYNLAGQMISEIYPSGKEIKTSYDSAARINDVSRYISGAFEKRYASQFSYAPHGAVAATQLGNGKWEHTLFNGRLQPTEIGLGGSNGTSEQLKLEYTYSNSNPAIHDNNGNVLTQKITPTGSGNLVLTQTYTYDSLNRLLSAREDGSPTWIQTYDYDRYGNRAVRNTSYIPSPSLTPQSASSTDFSAFDQPTNRLNRNIQPQANVTYDNAGNLTHDAGSGSYSYDAENRQTAFNGTVGQYSYDGDGRRVKKIDNDGTTIFVYNAGGQLIAEYTSGTPPGGGTSYLTSDHLGSTRVVTKSDGTVKARYDYLPFGEEIGSTIGGRGNVVGYGGADSTKQKFTQKERDIESGLDYFRARYYSSAQGRFTSVDPHNIILEAQATAEASPQKAKAQFLNYLAAPQQWNRYSYVANNPLVYVDPTGEILELTGSDEERKRAFERIKDVVGSRAAGSLYIREENGHYFVETNSGTALDASGKLGVVVNDVISSSTVVQFRVSSSSITENAAGKTVNLADSGGGYTGRFIAADGKSFIQVIVDVNADALATSGASRNGAVGDDGKPLRYFNDVADAHEFGHAYFYVKNLARFENAVSAWSFWKRGDTIGGLKGQSNRTSVDVENWARERRGLNKRTEH